MQIIYEVRSADGWDGVLEGFRKAIDGLSTTYEATGELAGLPMRYVNKILKQRPRKKNLGPGSFGPLMGAACVRILFVRDDEMFALLQHRIVRRRVGRARLNASEAYRVWKRKYMRGYMVAYRARRKRLCPKVNAVS